MGNFLLLNLLEHMSFKSLFFLFFIKTMNACLS